ncbi:MAG: lytic transglycosylase domain-containing protein [bacterium]
MFGSFARAAGGVLLVTGLAAALAGAPAPERARGAGLPPRPRAYPENRRPAEWRQPAAQPGGVCAGAMRKNGQRWPQRLPEPLQSARRLYVTGSCLREAGHHKAAGEALREGMRIAPALAGPWRLQLFRNHLGAGDAGAATEVLRQLLAQSPPPELVEALRAILTDWPAPGGLPMAGPGAFGLLSAYIANTDPTPRDTPLIRRLLDLAPKFGEKSLPGRMEAFLWMLPPDKEAAEKWAGVFGKFRKNGFRPVPGARLRRVRNLFKLRLFERIVRELELPRLGLADRDEARSLGRYYFQSLLRLRKYRKAARRVADPAVLKTFAMGEKEALSQALWIDLKMRRPGAAQRKLKRWRAVGLPAQELPAIYFALARIFDQRKDIARVLLWCGRIWREFPDHRLAARAFWLPFWSLYNGGDLPRAAELGDRAIASTQAFDPEQRARFFYWRARIHSAQGNHEAAAETRRALTRLWPTSYYGLLARLPGGDGPEPPRYPANPRPVKASRPPQGLRAIYKEPPLRRALFLLVVGEEELAAGELDRMMGKPMAEGVLEELGRVFAFFGRFRLQFRLTANYYYHVLKRQPVADTPLWRYAFPRAYWDVVDHQTRRHQVSPFFVLAIMREESHYDAKAGSRAGARGLMQLMPATARQVARRNGIPFREEGLEEPEVNITLGTLYLKKVLKRFDWSPVHAAAAYNAGPNAVRRWKKQLGHLPLDEFVENIPYDETRAYVKRVIASYLIYRKLY